MDADLLRHLPADEDDVGPLGQRAENADLVLDLRAADDRDERVLGALEQAAELLELAQQKEPRVGREDVRDALGRRVGAVRRAERVVHVEVVAVGELPRELGVVRGLARVEAGVLEHA